jgi:hypothetical protein
MVLPRAMPQAPHSLLRHNQPAVSRLSTSNSDIYYATAPASGESRNKKRNPIYTLMNEKLAQTGYNDILDLYEFQRKFD